MQFGMTVPLRLQPTKPLILAIYQWDPLTRQYSSYCGSKAWRDL